jgi:hypothetical protein
MDFGGVAIIPKWRYKLDSERMLAFESVVGSVQTKNVSVVPTVCDHAECADVDSRVSKKQIGSTNMFHGTGL